MHANTTSPGFGYLLLTVAGVDGSNLGVMTGSQENGKVKYLSHAKIGFHKQNLLPYFLLALMNFSMQGFLVLMDLNTRLF